MYSLNSYKEQVYNLGSPQPNPAKSPFESLPKVSQEFNFSDSKITTRPKRKTNLSDISEPKSPAKKSKMMSIKEVNEMFSGLQKTLMSLNEKVGDMSRKLNDNGDRLNEFQETMQTNNKNLEGKINNLEGEFSKLQEAVETSTAKTAEEVKTMIVPFIRDEIVPEIKSDIKTDVLKAADGAWKEQLSEKVKEHENSAIVFGLAVTRSAFDDAVDFLDNHLKLDKNTVDKILLTGASRLGKGDGRRPPPLLMNFSSPPDRNLVLSFSKNYESYYRSARLQV